jgi:hypothetical protein
MNRAEGGRLHKRFVIVHLLLVCFTAICAILFSPFCFLLLCKTIDCAFVMRTVADIVPSNVIDLYNVTTKAWSTAELSVARYSLSATSVGGVAIFAGGWTSGTLQCIGERGMMLHCCVEDACLFFISLLVALQTVTELLLSGVAQVSFQLLRPVPLICTMVHWRLGRRQSLAWRGLLLQLHRLGTWPSSREVPHQVRCDYLEKWGQRVLLV